MSISLSPYKGIFGLPPPSHTNHEMITNSMPVLEITPGEPNFKLGLTLFTVNTLLGWNNYMNILNNHGFELAEPKPLKFAFIADNFPTDTFTNEYTETFLQKTTDVASSGLSQLVQMSGERDAIRAMETYGKVGVQAGKDIGGALGSAIGGASGMAVKGAQAMKNFVESTKESASASKRFLGGGMDLVSKMLAGHRIDFPQIWSNSGYSPSYSVTIRLYNPEPGNKTSVLRYIAGPLCVLLCLAVPRTLNGASYRWPFYHKMRVRGLYELDPAVITNITVVKGGDQQQIAFNQMMTMCDVRIDFVSLHKSMLLEEGYPAADNRPTVRRYISELTNGRDVATRADMNNANNTRMNAGAAAMQKEKVLTYRQQLRFQKHLKASIRLPEGVAEEDIGPTVTQQRVTAEEEAAGELIITQTPDGVIVTRTE
jgi:hypothetical protein